MFDSWRNFFTAAFLHGGVVEWFKSFYGNYVCKLSSCSQYSFSLIRSGFNECLDMEGVAHPQDEFFGYPELNAAHSNSSSVGGRMKGSDSTLLDGCYFSDG
jgi:hypothetical protein